MANEISQGAGNPKPESTARAVRAQSSARASSGSGNPEPTLVARLRQILFETEAGEAKATALMNKLIEMAEGGDLKAMQEIFNRLDGEPGAVPVRKAVRISDRAACDILSVPLYDEDVLGR